jgi:L-serine deaminase
VRKGLQGEVGSAIGMAGGAWRIKGQMGKCEYKEKYCNIDKTLYNSK